MVSKEPKSFIVTRKSLTINFSDLNVNGPFSRSLLPIVPFLIVLSDFGALQHCAGSL